jgi:hypothetical protein
MTDRKPTERSYRKALAEWRAVERDMRWLDSWANEVEDAVARKQFRETYHTPDAALVLGTNSKRLPLYELTCLLKRRGIDAEPAAVEQAAYDYVRAACIPDVGIEQKVVDAWFKKKKLGRTNILA